MSRDNQLIVAAQQEKEKKFWLNRLSGELVKSFFPYAFDNWQNRGEACSAAVVPFQWTGALSSGLWAQSGGSPYKIHIILLAGISLLLDKYTGNGDIIVITPVYKPESEEGSVNVVLPVRTQPGTQNNFRELLKRVSKTVVDASAHQNYPMNVLLEQIGMPLIQGEPSLFDTALVIENIHDPGHIRCMNPGVIFSLRVTGDSINGKVEYPANLYERTAVERIIVHLGRLLGQAVQNLDCPLSQLEIVSEQEKKQLLYEYNHQKGLSLLARPEAAPLPGQRVYILDRYNLLQPPGLEGEVRIAGPALTGGREDPFFPGQRMVKTGAVGRWQPDGTFEFSGRAENRFLYKGCRIQPEKLERYLLKLAPLDEVVVTLLKDEYRGDSLRAYFVSPKELSPTEIKEQLAGKLPGYSIPGSFARLDSIPLTPAGQMDRDPRTLQEAETRAKARFAVPADITEEKLRNIWSEVLEIDREEIPVDLDFSQFGGQSLKAIMMSSKIHKVFNISIPIPTIFRLSTIRRLAQYVKETIKTEFCPIVAAEKRDYYELSPGHKRLYLLQQLDLESTGYNVPQMVIVEGVLHREQLERAFTRLIRRHESLRTSFRVVEYQPVQKIHRQVEFISQYVEPDHDANKQDGKGYPDIEANFVRPFDLSQAPLLRVRLVKENNSRHILMVDRHHIISDATSRGIFLKDLIRLYEGKELPPLRLQYKDYSQWQNSHKQKQQLKEQENYWLEQFHAGGEIPVLNLPLDYPRPRVQSFAGNDFGFALGEEETQKIRQLATGQGATLFIVLLAVYTIFLARLCNQEDIIVGTPVIGRRHEDLKDILGIFVNTLALRNFPVSGKSVKEFLNDVKTRALGAFENQVYPFEELVDRLVINRDISRNPLFDTVFMLQELGSPGMEPGELNVRPYEYRSTTAKFDLMLSAAEENHILYFVFEYGTKLFKESTIQRYAGFFKKIIAGVLENNDKKISGIDILTAEEKERLLLEFNRAYTGYPREKTLHRLFAGQAAKTPDHTALVGQSPNPKPQIPRARSVVQLTYKELQERTGRWVDGLKEKGIQPDDIVGIRGERSVEMVMGILGILGAGGAYLPIAANYPADRVNYILSDSGAKVLLKEDDLSSFLSSAPGALLNPSAGRPFHPHHSSSGTQHCKNLAYVIYTSGSTGRPKGVMVEQGPVVNLLYALQNRYLFSPRDTYLLKTSYMFDVSVTELFGWFMGGGRLAVLEPGGEKDPEKILATLERHEVTHINFVPSMFNVFTAALHPGNPGKLRRLRYIFLAGEALLAASVERFLRLNSAVLLENLYGPTEAVVYASGYSLSGWNGSGPIPIGKGLPNVTLYILDRLNVLQPIGVPGELCIGGVGLARGYLNQPELTAEKFDHDEKRVKLNKKRLWGVQGGGFLEKSPPGRRRQKIYKTGDLARWLEDGNIEFLGRIDHQVKIRGFRIELEEIESRLLRHPEIRQAVVAARGKNGSGDGYLCAYIILGEPPGDRKEKTAAGAAELKEFLAGSLPDYMIPSYFMELEKIPLTPTGKVHRDALPAPGTRTTSEYTAPRDEIEEKLVNLWTEVLSGDAQPLIPGIDDNFFELGGHSLKAILMAAKIDKELDINIPLAETFKTPTIRGLSRYIREMGPASHKAVTAAEKKEYYQLSSAQKRLYVIWQMDLESIAYNMPLSLCITGRLDKPKFEATLHRLIKRHESLRTSFEILEGEPVQQVHDEVDFEIESGDLATGGKDINSLIRPFDLCRAPLLRLGWLKIEAGKHLLVVDLHHIISDEVSHGIFINHLLTLYAGNRLHPPRLQYKDFSEWQNKQIESGEIKKQETYWLETFAGDIPLLRMPIDYERPAVLHFQGNTMAFEIDSVLNAEIKTLVWESKTTLNILLLAAYNVLLAKYTGQNTILVGTVIAGRRHVDLQNIIGFFVNMLPMKNHLQDRQTFAEFLSQVKETAIRAYENQDYSFEELVGKLDIAREAGRQPLIDTVFVMQNLETGRENPRLMEDSGLKATPYETDRRTAHFDLMLRAVAKDDLITMTIEYSSALFKPATIETFSICYLDILEQVVKNKKIELKDIVISHDIMAESSDKLQDRELSFEL